MTQLIPILFSLVSIILLIPVSAIPQTDTLHLANARILPPLGDGISSQTFDLIADILEFNSTIRFALETNDDLISQDARAQNWIGYGQTDSGNQLSNGLHMTKGTSWIQGRTGEEWDNAGWARLAVSQAKEGVSFDGTFTLFHSQYEIQLEGNDGELSRMIAQKQDSDFIGGNQTSHSSCATAPEDFLTRRQLGLVNAWSDNLESTIGNTDGCPKTRQVANIGIMTDCTYTASFNSSDSARRYILNMVNTASVVFENSFNISISIQNLTISDEQCPSTTSQSTAWNTPCSNGDMNSRLQAFSSWRGSINDNNAYWTLLTGCSVNGGEVGVSWIGALCNSGSGGSSNGGASANVVARTQSEWQVFAHESAHTFGAVHDCDSTACGGSGRSQCCPMSSSSCDADGQYIMNPVSGRGMTRFSPCTIGNVCSRMGSGQVDSQCLVGSDGNSTGTSGQCGNGIVEAGEACDCGDGACDERETQCCDSLTCQWKGGSDCRSDTRGGNDGGRGTTGTGTGSGSSNGDSLSSWVNDHLTLVIGLAAGIGGALLLLVLGCIICSCRRPKSAKIPIQR
ncbi:unnamed protein product [Penicillium salamii]|uniref:Zincin n=1 Tax=Penicillium salamii TaxID=1612424 RepID=A0A9W4J805_9EURO|nr:unnamed protein product [Penicillium salamii]CAG7980549.1 unnamed protein product [Penicillium salamii]CAG8078489.1 unnamed protein product [Penicillium salamii]CAG8082024.1 unnamed protein product [Penicillium salamii]CAG8238192.1 unnamed protein product [Penicillium salamii]